jgi:hypothetical protein
LALVHLEVLGLLEDFLVDLVAVDRRETVVCQLDDLFHFQLGLDVAALEPVYELGFVVDDVLLF